MGLESLPDELLCEIFELLSYEEGPSTEDDPDDLESDSTYRAPQELLSLLRCSHRLHRVGIPFLYRTFVQSNPRSWVPFIRTTLSHPDLADHVRNIKLSSEGYNPLYVDTLDLVSKDNVQIMHYYLESRTINDQIQALSAENDFLQRAQNSKDNIKSSSTSIMATGLTAAQSLSQLKHGSRFSKSLVNSMPRWVRKKATTSTHTSIPSTGLPTSHDAEEIVDYIFSGHLNAATVYLLYRLPNLESITLTLQEKGFHADRDYEQLILRAMSPSAINISQLRNLTLIHLRRGWSSKLDNHFSLLFQPSVRCFSAVNIREYGWLPTPRDLQLPLTSLSISNSNLSTSSIDAFLKCCPNLSYLFYEHAQKLLELPFIPRHFSISIRHLQHTLQHLTLYRTNLPDNFPARDISEFSILGPALKEFSVLKSLEVTTHLLLGPQASSHSKWWELSKDHDCPTQPLMECLPRSLKQLKLADCADNVLDEVRELAVEKSGVVPQLEVVIVAFLTLKSVGGLPDAMGDVVLEEELVGDVKIRSFWRIKKKLNGTFKQGFGWWRSCSWK